MLKAICWVAYFALLVEARITGIPSVPFNETGTGSLQLSSISTVKVDAKYTNAVDSLGSTEIPPTLSEFAVTFQEDLADRGVYTRLSADSGNHWQRRPSIYLTIGNDTGFVDVAGRFSSEAYKLTVNSQGITITGASPLGVWWGTRSLLQIATLKGGKVPYGEALDSPGWKVRGVMLDAGRHYYPPDFVVDMCTYMSYFKQNTLQLHMSDNVYDNPRYDLAKRMNAYASFRPAGDNPALDGLNKRQNESYYESDMETMQRKCVARGVTILPELESPGHSLAVGQWKPELALGDDYSLLNLTHPDTIPLEKEIWKTYVPWFHSKTVHIGADEYSSSYIPEYIDYINTMADYIYEISGKATRVWGTFHTPSSGNAIHTNVSVQHWTETADNVKNDLFDYGYEVVNTCDELYLVNKWSQWYDSVSNVTKVFLGDLGKGPMTPNIFSSSNASYNFPIDEPRIMGHMIAIWNDMGPTASTYHEAYYAMRQGIPAIADKQWGGDLTLAEFVTVFETVQEAAPAVNLDCRIDSVGDTIVEYKFGHSWGKTVRDKSGNNYHGKLVGDAKIINDELVLSGNGYLETPLSSKGRNYTLSFSVMPTSNHSMPLLSGPLTELWSGNGTSSKLMFVAAGNAFPLNYTLPANEYTDVTIETHDTHTYFTAGTGPQQEFLAIINKVGTLNFKSLPISFEAPLAKIGSGFTGRIKNFKLVNSKM